MYCVWRNKGNATICECIIISYTVSLCFLGGGVGVKLTTFMAVICDMDMGRLVDHKYFLEIVHD